MYRIVSYMYVHKTNWIRCIDTYVWKFEEDNEGGVEDLRTATLRGRKIINKEWKYNN